VNEPEASSPRTRRLFFALWPDDATRQELAHATRKAVRGSGGRPVPVANLHATVAFLGNVAADLVPAIEAAASTVHGARFELTLDAIDFWPRPQVLVAVATETPPEAVSLAAALWSAVTPLGLQPDLRPFRAHVTLARKVHKPHEGLGMHPVHWVVPDLALVESRTDPEGARYAVLRSWSLSS
jgi:RNA 2',3'-cyclic 3'-phosphodiesterase